MINVSTTIIENNIKSLTRFNWDIRLSVTNPRNAETYKGDLLRASEQIENGSLDNRHSISAILEQLARLI